LPKQPFFSAGGTRIATQNAPDDGIRLHMGSVIGVRQNFNAPARRVLHDHLADRPV